ncbi:hypothetical protein SAMN02745220_01642 [Desulfopila aestuarii DSM 18488]|uniref:Uncharacterized protein n=1 Tax=Desulfopila aestuarii DSM 18488 TaxID=1121416 RepID=A0A1M7Y3R2_9BACT|nr:hypothetical protein SAMN02745220_01642 [Desulfopila aestuarii DSM 18488]
MGRCRNHPERETNHHCLKHNVFLCEECLSCLDPELYCKFRTSCTIWFVHKEKVREERMKSEK